jgi:hypothetical protein
MNGIAAAIGVLRDAYPRQDFPDRSVALYATALADLDDGELLAAVRRLIRRSAWLPSISEIREEVAEARLGLPSPDEAWALVQAETPKRSLPPEVADTLRALGGSWAIRTTTQPDRLHRDFIESYRRIRDRRVLAEQGALADDGYPAANGTPLPPGEPAAVIRSLNARRVAEIPESTRIRPRPVVVRLTNRWRTKALPPPTDAEMADAIEILRQGPTEGDDPLFVEAQRILDEASAA